MHMDAADLNFGAMLHLSKMSRSTEVATGAASGKIPFCWEHATVKWFFASKGQIIVFLGSWPHRSGDVPQGWVAGEFLIYFGFFSHSKHGEEPVFESAARSRATDEGSCLTVGVPLCCEYAEDIAPEIFSTPPSLSAALIELALAHGIPESRLGIKSKGPPLKKRKSTC